MQNKINLLLKHIYQDIIYFIINSFIKDGRSRAKLFNVFYPDIVIGKDSVFRKSITLYNGSRLEGELSVGSETFINDECFIDYSSKVIIGNNVSFGMRVLILSSSHKIDDPMRCGIKKNKTTIIKDNCWLGAGVLVYPGVIIEKGCVIAAGEIVDENIPENKLLKKGVLMDIDIKNYGLGGQ